jgi:WhiB family redox-sensing transcriptional regulator
MSGLPDVSALPGPNADLWDWQMGARCRELPTAVFFHPWGERGDRRHRRESAAKEICASCPSSANAPGTHSPRASSTASGAV